jgi:replicative DNA helicase
MHRLTYMVGKAHVPLKPIYPAMLRVMGLVSKRHIDPADGNCAPRGFKEYDKRTNGFCRRTFAVISGWALADSRKLQLDIVYYAAVSGLPSAIFCPRLSRLEHHVGGGQRTEKASSRMTVSMRAKGDYAMHSARFCDHMPLYVNSERLLWYPLWMTAVG